jgi:enoyl-[acyl-carrier protein] reductase/trans-2-enoyl-CoA reductase (NAD+)
LTATRSGRNDIQAEVARRWRAATPDTVDGLADIAWFRVQFRGLYGFDVPGVDYDQPVEIDLPWPTELGWK